MGDAKQIKRETNELENRDEAFRNDFPVYLEYLDCFVWKSRKFSFTWISSIQKPSIENRMAEVKFVLTEKHELKKQQKSILVAFSDFLDNQGIKLEKKSSTIVEQLSELLKAIVISVVIKKLEVAYRHILKWMAHNGFFGLPKFWWKFQAKFVSMEWFSKL